MVRRNLVVVGASAGGVEALGQLLEVLPADLDAAVLLVLHMSRSGSDALPRILSRSSVLPVRAAENGQELQAGTVTVALPDQHLIVVDGRVGLSRGPRENGHRPAIDVLFRSAARAVGPRVVAVVLSGALDDGTAGMIAVRQRGGVGIAQDPSDALYPSMPRSAVQVGGADHVVPVEKMGELLERLTSEELPGVGGPPSTELMDAETAMAELDADTLNQDERPGTPSGFGCPSCGGALFTITEGGMERYRCRVGHAWSPEALAEEQSQALEGALWMALRGLEERAALAQRMGDRARQRGHAHSERTFRRRHEEAHGAAAVLRRLLQRGELGAEAMPDEVGED